MKYRSTGRNAPPLSFGEALVQGLAPDGGLYVPERFPEIAWQAVSEASFSDVAIATLAPFFEDDPLQADLRAIVERAFDFPIPLTALANTAGTYVLELFHGPTAAFKDVGARFMAECLSRRDHERRTVLVATSGDTGSAVAAALDGKESLDVVILFPKGGVSAEQERLLTCWSNNVHAFAVQGAFDDCQRMLKQALGTPGSLGERTLTTANSINIARLLPQTVYYASAALEYHSRHGSPATFVVPTGNVGNATAALWAKRMGFPVQRIVMAANSNRPVPDYLETGEWTPRPSIPTLANAMDVGNPSNIERVFDLYASVDALRGDVSATTTDDATLREVIAHGKERYGRVFDPHTAAAVNAFEIRGLASAVLVSTAHPAKFQSVVEPILGQSIEIPEALARLHERPARVTEIPAAVEALQEALR
ncbi:MAG: threonine synthase [Planctomycetes bacterium]|jgi:threonine synthase|nr:threonine synthase [Planctomycetota bacterium]